MNTLIRETNGKEQIWYSEEYLKSMIENAYKSGMWKGRGMKVFNYIPSENSKELIDTFKEGIESEYNKAFEASEVWRKK